jgi:hypothetical protein
MGDNGLAAPSPYPENHRIYISVLYYLELVFFFLHLCIIYFIIELEKDYCLFYITHIIFGYLLKEMNRTNTVKLKYVIFFER